MNEKVVAKIKKLLALSKSSNEEESKSAILKAQELLMKNKLSMKDIEDYSLDISSVTERESTVSFKKAKWKGQLAGIIADNFACKLFFYTCFSQRPVFMGREEDVAICEIVLLYAVDSIMSVVKKLQYQKRKQGESTLGLEGDYALGFVSGLEDRFERQKSENAEWGLVVQVDEGVIKKYEEKSKSFKGSVSLETQFSGNSNAYYQGVEDGKNFDISNKIANEGNEGNEGNEILLN